jgi:hypothetical protein
VRFLGIDVGPSSASAAALTFPGICASQWARSSAISTSISAGSMPSISPSLAANIAGHLPA